MALPLGTDVQVLGDGRSGGVTVCRSTSELFSVYGVTPVAQQSGANQGAVATTAISSVATTAATSSTPYGYGSSQANALITGVNAAITRAGALTTLVNQLRSDLVDVGLIKGSA